MPESKTSPRRIVARERQGQALELRKAGCTYLRIAEQLGYSGPGGAERAVRSALARITFEPAQEVLALERARYDDLLLAVWPAAKRGEAWAVDRSLKVMSQRAQLLGLNPPQGANLSISVNQEWVSIRTLVLQALDSFPEARESVLRSLNGHAN